MNRWAPQQHRWVPGAHEDAAQLRVGLEVQGFGVHGCKPRGSELGCGVQQEAWVSQSTWKSRSWAGQAC